MPYTDMPWVKQGVLTRAGQLLIALDTPEWFAWLERVDRFCYSAQQGGHRFTARKEERRGKFYWYAYCKKASKLHNLYLGKSERLTIAHLEQAARTLNGKARSARRAIQEVNE